MRGKKALGVILSPVRLPFRHTGCDAPGATFANALSRRKQPIRQLRMLSG